MDRSPSFPFRVNEKGSSEPKGTLSAGLVRSAITAADAYHATRSGLRIEAGVLRIGNRFRKLPAYREVAIFAAGNAAGSQALAATHALGSLLTQGFIAAPEAIPREVPFRSVRVARGLPGSREGQEAARAALELAEGLGERDLLVLLLSSGALASVALPPVGWSGTEFAGALDRLHRRGASSREVLLVASALGTGGSDGGIAGAARGAEVESIVLDRGDGGGLVGGSPGRRLTEGERDEARQILDRSSGGDPTDRSTSKPLRVPDDPPPPLRASVGRPVVVASPPDALRGAADLAGDKRYRPRLAGVGLPGSPAEVARSFTKRLDELLEKEPGLRTAPDSKGAVILATTTFELPEGFDERPSLRVFLDTARPLLRHRGTTLVAFATSGSEPGAEPAGLAVVAAGRDGSSSGYGRLPASPGITDVACVLAAEVPPVLGSRRR
ncbi:MAG: DUF4147 domain-containing protein [Thermoplasmata archaeon]|nr:DUF4147 domain-containing protein [Thermoplasmata archaeon]